VGADRLIIDRATRQTDRRVTFQPNLTVAENLALPVVDKAWKTLSRRRNIDRPGLLSSAAAISLRKSLRTRLAFTSEQAAEWTCNVLRLTPGLTIDDRELRRLLFCLGSEAATARFLSRYPALAQLWSTQVKRWLRYAGELMRRAEDFSRFFAPRNYSGPLIRSLRLDLSDLHDGNRAVAEVQFADGSRWFYKPRSGASERGWFDLLRQLNAGRAPARFYLVNVVCRRHHFWMKQVQHRPCGSREGAGRFFYRAGALLHLVHRLGGVDYHAGNVVAHGEHPVIIDCETFFHPRSKLPRKWRSEEASVVRTGMLPIAGTTGAVSDSVSALGRMSAGHHCVRLGGSSVSASEFVGDIVEGFQAMFEYLQSERGRRILLRHVHRMREYQVRRIYKPTSCYYRILWASLSAARLRDASTRRAFLESACGAGTTPLPYHKQEVAALETGDIPAVRARPASLRPYSERAMWSDVSALRTSLRTRACKLLVRELH
jgi:lantibiotic modifying enzyme